MIFNPRVVQLTGARIALLPPSDLAASAGNTQVSLTWTDPGDETSGGQIVVEWEFTRIVRKTGSAPANQNDGVIVLDSTVKNQYLSEPFVDTGLTNGTTYYYGAFACSTAGAWSDGAFVSATPQDAYILGELTEGTLVKIKENGSPVEFYVAKQNYEPGLNGDGRTLMVRKYVYDQRQWNNTNSNNWVTSTMLSWLNSTYKAFFSSSVQELMHNTTYYYTPYGNNSSVATRSDDVFLPSLTELGESQSWANVEGSALPIASTLKVAYQDGFATSQWTRSPSTTDRSNAWALYSTGGPGNSNCINSHGSRPCFTLPAESLVDLDMNLIEGESPPVEDTPLSELAEGTLITIKENGTPVEFYVAKQNYEPGLNGEGRTLMARKECYNNSPWYTAFVNTYAVSNIDNFFNTTYKNLLSSAVVSLISTTNFYYTPGKRDYTVSTLSRSVFALSVTELGEQPALSKVEGSTLPIFATLKIAYLNGSPSFQWTRSPNINNQGHAWALNSNGGASDSACNLSYGARPCFTLPSTALVDPSNALIES